MTTLVLLDTNTYLRLAKRIRPLLGKPFGQKNYALTILRDVENEVTRSPRLQFHYPWFDEPDLLNERLAKQIRLSKDERQQINAATTVLRAYVLENATEFSIKKRSPPSQVDCFCLAFGQVRPAIVATDDLGMHALADVFSLNVWHGHELLKKMLSAKAIDAALIKDIYEALENNNDLPESWKNAKHTSFKKIFGPPQ